MKEKRRTTDDTDYTDVVVTMESPAVASHPLQNLNRLGGSGERSEPGGCDADWQAEAERAGANESTAPTISRRGKQRIGQDLQNETKSELREFCHSVPDIRNIRQPS